LEPRVEVVVVTPEMASEWLNHNTHNRNVYQRNVDELVGIIERGEWQLTNDAIAFDDRGTLLNGQHRLWAIIITEKPQPLLVMRDVNSESQLAYDQGRKRNLANELQLRGYTSSLDLAATVSMKWKFDNDLLRVATKPTVQQGLRVLEQHPGLVDASKWARTYFRKRFSGSGAVVGLCYYEFMQDDPDAASAFFEQLIEGVGLTRRSPVHALRRQLEQGKMSPLMLMALTIKAWNAYVEGREIEHHLVWRPVGKHAEAFPRISGR
jgi:hypothetical protein